jgi:hypothetical protein
MGSFAPKGHARLDPQRPAAFAICERCGFLYNHRDLRWDMQWRGNQVMKTGFLVCQKCADEPNQTLRPKVLPPDPVPVLNPRAETPHVYVPSVAFAALPAPVLNLTAWVNDSRTRTVGAIVNGGGSFKVPVIYNGTNWVVQA